MGEHGTNMIKVVGLIFALFVVSATNAGTLPNVADVVEEQHSTVVQVAVGTNGIDPQTASPTAIQNGFGSGFVISEDGYIMTNAHVVKEADVIKIRLPNRKVYDAEVVGSDSETDIAVLKIDAENLQVVKFGNSDKLRSGDWVIALGQPFGFDQTITAGVVSALNRTVPREQHIQYIQHDAAVNPGGSGGPLFNLDGEVVGVNTQIYTRSAGYIGIVFSVPINDALWVADQLKENGIVTRGWLGVEIKSMTQQEADELGLEVPTGAVVGNVSPDSPAREAGLQEGDVIIQYNDVPVWRIAELILNVGQTKIGDTATFRVLRDGQQIALQASIRPFISPPSVFLSEVNPQLSSLDNLLGIQVQRGETFNIIVDVKEDSAAYDLVSPGDMLMAINNTATTTLDEFNEGVAKLKPGEDVVIIFQTRDNIFKAKRITIPE